MCPDKNLNWFFLRKIAFSLGGMAIRAGLQIKKLKNNYFHSKVYCVYICTHFFKQSDPPHKAGKFVSITSVACFLQDWNPLHNPYS